MFTFVMDFRGGTYISQVQADSHIEAVSKWVEGLGTTRITHFGPKSHSELVMQLNEEKPVAIAGMQNAWCLSALLKTGLALIHFFETVPEKGP